MHANIAQLTPISLDIIIAYVVHQSTLDNTLDCMAPGLITYIHLLNDSVKLQELLRKYL